MIKKADPLSAATKKLEVGSEPSLGGRFFWALIQGGLALAVISLGGMGTAKIFGNFAGALMLVPIVFALIAWFKFMYCHDLVKEEAGEREAEERKQLAKADCETCVIVQE